MIVAAFIFLAVIRALINACESRKNQVGPGFAYAALAGAASVVLFFSGSPLLPPSVIAVAAAVDGLFAFNSSKGELIRNAGIKKKRQNRHEPEYMWLDTEDPFSMQQYNRDYYE